MTPSTLTQLRLRDTKLKIWTLRFMARNTTMITSLISLASVTTTFPAQSARRSTVIMIPAKVRCPDSTWTNRYSSYIMVGFYLHHRNMFTCVDRSAEAIPGMAADVN